jgi:hypothetical protein
MIVRVNIDFRSDEWVNYEILRWMGYENDGWQMSVLTSRNRRWLVALGCKFEWID